AGAGGALHVPGRARPEADAVSLPAERRAARHRLPLQPGRPRFGVLLGRRELRLRAFRRDKERTAAPSRGSGLQAAQPVAVAGGTRLDVETPLIGGPPLGHLRLAPMREPLLD